MRDKDTPQKDIVLYVKFERFFMINRFSACSLLQKHVLFGRKK